MSGEVTGRIERDGPVRVVAEVVTRRRSGPYTTLVLAAPELAGRCRPGQFLEIAVEAPATLLRRPLSIARAEDAAGGIGTVEVVVGPDGVGSAWLAAVETGRRLDVVGPLGKAFPIPQRTASCLLVGGGYGAAPLHYLTEVLVPLGHRVDLIVGASSESTLLHSLEAKRLAHGLTTTTDDGSAGLRGRVTDAMPDAIVRGRTDVIYACGPNAMLAAVSALGERMGVPVRVALEERMACGLGICFTCVIPVRDKEGAVQMRRSCIDGPVMDGARVDWRRMGLDAAVDAVEAMDLTATVAGAAGDGEAAP
jgi:dihydroorotate dehydrogenase electron transfer subunit